MIEKLKNNNRAYPFLKWAGGKRQLLPILEKNLPQELLSGKIENYYEPFLGSGAMFFFLADKFFFKNIFLSDTNSDLILTFNVIKHNVELLIDALEKQQEPYLILNSSERKQFYYSVRTDFNQERETFNYTKYNRTWVNRAAKLIFLNKTCYNGLFRLNSKGEFNTPAGDYKNPKICDKANLHNVSSILKHANLEIKDFKSITKSFLSSSFVYFDPPYRPLNATSNFTSYSKNSFSDDDQKELKRIFSELDKKGGKLMLSNSDPKNNNAQDNFFDEIYKDFNIKRIPAKRYINSNAEKRGEINELLILNY